MNGVMILRTEFPPPLAVVPSVIVVDVSELAGHEVQLKSVKVPVEDP